MYPANIPRKHFGGLLLIVVVSFSFGIWYWLRTNTPGSQPRDFHTYNQLAISLIGQGTLDYSGIPIVPPGYPVFLALVYLLAGKVNVIAASVANIFLFSLVAGLTGWVGMRLYGPTAGYIAGILVSLSHDMVFISQFALSEFLYTLLLLFCAISLNKYFQLWKVGWLIVAGLFAGFAALTRGAILIYIPFILLWIVIITPGSIWFRLFRVVAFFTAFSVLAFLWSYWVSAKTNEFVPVANYGALQLYVGNNLTYYHALRASLFGPGFAWGEFSLPALSNEQMLLQVWRFIIDTPQIWLHLYLLKLYFHLQFYNLHDIPSIRIAIWSSIYWISIWSLVILFIVKNKHFWRSIFLWLIVANLFIHPLIYVAQYARYRVPVEPLLALLASGGFAMILPQIIQQCALAGNKLARFLRR